MNEKPEKSFRLGSVHASVFLNKDNDGRAFHTVTVQRRYKDGDQWKSANSFTATELANAVAVMQRAIVYLLDQQPANNIE